MAAIKIMGISLSLDWLIKIIMDMLAQVLDTIISGDELSDDQRRGVRTLYFLGHEWGKKAVEDTETELDDEGLKKILELCEDTAVEGEFSLPVME